MNIKQIAYLLVVINLFYVAKELPIYIIEFLLLIISLSLLIKNNPGRYITKVFLIITSFVVLKYNFKPLLVPEAGVSFILMVSALKLWELDSENDHYNMFLILALVEGSLFLLNPTLFIFCLGVFKIGLFFYFILRLRNYNLILLNYRRILILTLPALLFSGLLFYTFPRFTQAFSGVSSNARFMMTTGPSSNLDFKKLGPINQSSKIAFRVKGIPDMPRLYWRSLVLWGRVQESWMTNDSILKAPNEKIIPPKFDYQITLADNFNEYLPVLDGQTVISNSDKEYYANAEGTFRLKNVLKKEIHYSASTNYQTHITNHSPMMEKKGLSLFTTQKKEILKKIIGDRKISELSDQKRLDLITDFFKNKKYQYSLSPPAYESIEDFINNGTSGYCSHFAAAYVFMAKLLQLPSRIVMGYQGGEYNPFDNSLIIRELDGHAWAEIYLQDIGWKRVDPTELVVPDRVRVGALAFNEQINPTIKTFFHFAFLIKTEQWMDSVNYRFSDFLLNFDKEQQLKLLQGLLPNNLSIDWPMALALISPLIMVFFFYAYLNQGNISPEEKRYRKFLKRMKRNGYEKEINETASAFATRCFSNNKLSKSLLQFIQIETNYYIEVFYRNN